MGTLSFSNADYVSRQLAAQPLPQFIIFDLHRVTSLTRAGARLVAEEFRALAADNVTVILAGVKRDSREWDIIREWTGSLTNVRDFYLRRGYRATGPQTPEGAWPMAKELLA